jgi:hypothetical protein
VRVSKLRSLFLSAIAIAAASAAPTLAQAQDLAIAPVPRACPAGLDSVAACYGGRDAQGAWYVAAVPREWNQVLIVHAHGGPRLGEPGADDSDEDLERFAVMVRTGHAWIGSTYRRGGFGVRMAAEDVDNSRDLFIARFGQPRRIILHGQSYGGNVAAKLAELRSIRGDGSRLYDGVLLTNSILWGGTRAYQFRADLRAVYQFVCRNHPAADERAYPLWQGLPVGSRLTRADLESRVNQCTGLDRPAARRTPEQAQRLATITAVTGIAPANILRHLEWGTFHFRALVQWLGGGSPFDNSRTLYRGSSDDTALNQGIERFAADPATVSALRYDSDLSGRIMLPTLALNWRDDPVVSAEAAAEYERQVGADGNGHLFWRLVTGEGTHSRLADAEYAAALTALLQWIESGDRPSVAATESECHRLAQQFSAPCSLTAP